MTPKMRAKYIEVLRAIPMGRRFEITADLCDTLRENMAAGIRNRHPEYAEYEVSRELIRMTVPEDLRKKAYGW
jgi:hypothetical protein